MVNLGQPKKSLLKIAKLTQNSFLAQKARFLAQNLQIQLNLENNLSILEIWREMVNLGQCGSKWLENLKFGSI